MHRSQLVGLGGTQGVQISKRPKQRLAARRADAGDGVELRGHACFSTPSSMVADGKPMRLISQSLNEVQSS